MLVLALLIVYGAVSHLISPSHVKPGPVLAVALVGIVVNLMATRALGGHGHGPHQHDPGSHGHAADDPDHTHDHAAEDHAPHGHEPPKRSLNVEGSYQHMLTDLFGFIATAIAAAVIIASGFRRADALASLLIAAIMLHAAYGLLRASVRVIMEAAPEGFDPDAIGHRLAAQAGVAEVHDLHIWEVTSGFNAVSAHIVVDAGYDCHEVRRQLSRLLADEFALRHSTLQVEHARAAQAPLQIEVSRG
jgi:cobalt-zinc-cadmium efflux system protein